MSNKNHPVLKQHRKKVWAAFISLLIAAVMIVTATFAWLTLSTAPEVVGVTTNVGANGSLEIALLNTLTRNDLSAIATGVGTSSEAVGAVAANVTWGNIVDLSSSYYGLDQIKLMPAQFLVEASNSSATGYGVNPNGPLGMPTYGTDGRIIRIDTNAVSAVYSSNQFGLSENQTYGVRGLGTSNGATSGSSLLSLAKSYISSYSGSAKVTAINTINSNGTGLVNILLTHSASDSATYGDSDIGVLKSIISDLSTSYGFIETAIRYGILANAVQNGADSSVAYDIRDTANSIADLYTTYAEYCPDEMATWIAKAADGRATLNSAYNECAALTGNSYTWDQVQPILESLINLNYVYIDDALFSSVDTASLMASTGFTMSLIPGSGVFSDLAAFTGEYSTWLSLLGKQVEFKTRTNADPTYLTALGNTIDTSAAGDVTLDSLKIDNLGGYAIDLAFRCNAADSDLQLQIAPEQRVYTDSTASDLQGAGSYMQFSNNDGSLTTGQMIELMDAIRVTFVDINGDILAMAKLNTSNRSFEDNGDIKASLYLYNYSVVAEDGVSKIKIGERRTGDVKITELTQNVAKAVTAIVWIDGNIVDNSMVSAVSDSSLNGILNLQFSSSVDLIPAENGTLYNSNASRTDLRDQLDDKLIGYPVTDVLNRGQYGNRIVTLDDGTEIPEKWNYTNDSWNAFAAAYRYATVVLNNLESSSTQIKSAYNGLMKAYDELVEVSHAALIDLIHEVRELTGTTTEVAGYITNDGCLLTEYTQEEKDLKAANTPVYMINPENNLHDEGNGIQTPVYTEQSWKKLAIALYDAEAASAFEDATDSHITAAYTALELAYNMLERGVYYEAYELNGVIYYRAITSETDTYGKWYDADFNRIISDLKILDLDSSAVKAKVAAIEAVDQYEIGSGSGIAASIDLNKNAYPKFRNDEVIGLRWGFSGTTYDIDFNEDEQYEYETNLWNVLSSLVEQAEEIVNNPDIEFVRPVEPTDPEPTDPEPTDPEDPVPTIREILQGYIDEANDVLAHAVNKADAESHNTLLNNLAGAIEIARNNINEKAEYDEENRTEMNDQERTVLKAAILEAASLNPYAKVKDTEGNDTDELIDSEFKAVYENAVALASSNSVLRADYDDAIASLNDKIVEHNGIAQTADNAYLYFDRMTADERTILAAAILEAKRMRQELVEKGVDPGEMLLHELNSAEAVQANDESTRREYNIALEALNAAIESNGGKVQTAYNVLVYTVEHSPEYAEGLNRVVNPCAVMNPSINEYGTGYITARILTKNGVVYTTDPKAIFFYNKAAGADFAESGNNTFTFTSLINKVAEYEVDVYDDVGNRVIADYDEENNPIYEHYVENGNPVWYLKDESEYAGAAQYGYVIDKQGDDIDGYDIVLLTTSGNKLAYRINSYVECNETVYGAVSIWSISDRTHFEVTHVGNSCTVQLKETTPEYDYTANEPLATITLTAKAGYGIDSITSEYAVSKVITINDEGKIVLYVEPEEPAQP